MGYRMERDAPILQMKIVRQCGKPHRPGRAAAFSRAEPELSPPPWSDCHLSMERSLRHQTKTQFAKEMSDHTESTSKLARSYSAFSQAVLLPSLAYLLNDVSLQRSKPCQKTGLPAGRVGCCEVVESGRGQGVQGRGGGDQTKGSD